MPDHSLIRWEFKFILSWHGIRMYWVGGKNMTGAAYYVGASKRVICKRCGAGNLIWVQSKKTTKYYLAETMGSQSDNKAAADIRVAMPWMPHQCKA
jgi:hypothetical protein